MLRKVFKKNKGAALLEYALLIAGVSLMAVAAVSIFGHKTTDLVAAVASIIPGAHSDDNGPIVSGKIIETTAGSPTTNITVDTGAILNASGNQRLGTNLGLDLSNLVVEP